MNGNADLTIFTTCKPFSGGDATRQDNAFRSWLAMLPKPHEILLVDNWQPMCGIAQSYGFRFVDGLQRSETGTKLVHSLFARAEAEATTPLLAYCNADILLHGITDVAKSLADHPAPFLVIGRRWDMDAQGPLQFPVGWQHALREKALLASATAVDWFLFTKGLWSTIPPFHLGRFAWDNWLVNDAIERGMTVIDATGIVTAIHQSHAGQPRTGDDYTENLRLHGRKGVGLVTDAPWVLDATGLHPR